LGAAFRTPCIISRTLPPRPGAASASCSCPQRRRAASQAAAVSQQLQLQPEALFPAGAPVYEWCYEPASSGWVRWMATAPEYKCDVDKPFASLIVPTADSVRCGSCACWAACWGAGGAVHDWVQGPLSAKPAARRSSLPQSLLPLPQVHLPPGRAAGGQQARAVRRRDRHRQDPHGALRRWLACCPLPGSRAAKYTACMPPARWSVTSLCRPWPPRR
jgi:hypothetical protein